MKRLFLFLVMFSAISWIPASAMRNSDASGGKDNAMVEKKLMQMERDWADALLKGDISTIDRIEADTFVYTMDSWPGDKQADLSDAKSKAFTADSVEMTDLKVHVYGDAAVVTGKAHLHNAKYKGKDLSGDYLFTDTFVEKNGRWQAVASHSNKASSM